MRWGEHVYSPLIGRGEVGILVAFEKLEALRYVDMLRSGGTVIVGDMRIPPLSVSSGGDVYPDDAEVCNILGQATDDVHLVPSIRLAEEVGNVRAHNVVVLGALSTRIPQVPPEIWLEVIAEWVPKRFIEINRNAFQAGREVGLSAG
jgi:indolepyruvate ferredoxin oxidoreductase beta subunit